MLVAHINNKLGRIKPERIRLRIVRAELRRDSRDARGGQDPIGGLTWRSVAEKVVRRAYSEAVRRMTLIEDLFEQSELSRVCVLEYISGDSIEWSNIHVAVGVEVVDKLDLIDVLEDKIAHSPCLWLRERERSRESITAWVFSRAKVSMRETVVAIKIDTDEGVVAAEPLSAPRVIIILALHHVVGSLEEGLLDVEDAVDVENGHYIDSHVLKQVDVVLIVVDSSVQELEHNIEGHLNRDSLTSVMRASEKNSWSIFNWLLACLECNERNISAFVCLTKR